jgi:hypothetical protein
MARNAQDASALVTEIVARGEPTGNGVPLGLTVARAIRASGVDDAAGWLAGDRDR